MSVKFLFNPRLCSACGGCAVACMDQNDIDVAVRAPFRRVFWEKRGGAELPHSDACRHCKNAPCVAVCPSGCLTRDEETGLVACDSTVCVGCQACEAACPFHAISFDADGKAGKCDGCIDRLRAGLQPACVLACPADALRLEWK